MDKEEINKRDQKREKIDWSVLEEKIPDPVWRCRWNVYAEKYGLPYTRTYMQNLDSEGRGPDKKYLNKRVAYPRKSLIRWLNSL